MANVVLDQIYQTAREKVLHAIEKRAVELFKGLNDPPYNYVIHTAPFRRQKSGYWKSIDNDYHWHIEILPHTAVWAGFELSTGIEISTIEPEVAAQALRNIN